MWGIYFVPYTALFTSDYYINITSVYINSLKSYNPWEENIVICLASTLSGCSFVTDSGTLVSQVYRLKLETKGFWKLITSYRCSVHQ